MLVVYSNWYLINNQPFKIAPFSLIDMHFQTYRTMDPHYNNFSPKQIEQLFPN